MMTLLRPHYPDTAAECEYIGEKTPISTHTHTDGIPHQRARASFVLPMAGHHMLRIPRSVSEIGKRVLFQSEWFAGYVPETTVTQVAIIFLRTQRLSILLCAVLPQQQKHTHTHARCTGAIVETGTSIPTARRTRTPDVDR